MIIGMPVYDDVDMLDVTGPFELFDWAGITIELLAEEVGMTRFRSQGFAFPVTKRFADAGAYNALWVPGGDPKALERLIKDPRRTYLNFLVSQAKKTPLICSVCEGAMLLAAAGLLDGYRATTHWAFLPCFSEHFPNVTVEPGHPRYVHDRDRLTGGGISSALDEALLLIAILQGEEAALAVQRKTEYFPRPPVLGEFPSPPPRCMLSLP